MRGMTRHVMAKDGRTVGVDELMAHAGWVRELAWRLVRDDEVADELVQDTWVAALTHPPRSGRPVRPWLRTVLANFARKRLRSEAHRHEREEAAARRGDAGATDELVAEIELQRELTRDVLELREPYRGVLLRRFYRGESAAQIARRTGVPAGTVRSQIDRGLAILRERVAKRYGDGRAMNAALIALAGERPWQVLGTLASALQGAWTVKESGKLVGAVGAVALLALASVGAWRALDGDGTAASEPDTTPVEMAALPNEEETEEHVAEVEVGEERETVAPLPVEETAPEEARLTRLLARVIDGDGLPIQGATLGRREGDEGAARTGSDGRAVLELARSDLNVWGAEQENQVASVFVIACAGYETQFQRATPWQYDDTDLGDVVLQPGGSITGRVVDGSGAPISGIEVHALDARLERAPAVARRTGPIIDLGAPTASTDGDGAFELHGVPVGGARVWGEGSDGAWAFTDPIDVSARAETGGVELVLLALDPRDRIAGTVIDSEGEPVPRAWIRYQYPSGQMMTRLATADDEGRFEIVLEAREPHAVKAEDPEIVLTPAIERDVEPGTTDLVLQLTEPTWMLVHAVDGAGERVGKIQARTETDLPLGYDPNGAQRGPEDGVLKVRVPGEPFRVIVEADGFAEASRGPFDPDAAPETLELELDALAGISGRILFDDRPVAGAKVELHGVAQPGVDISSMGFRLRLDRYPDSSTKTDAEGRFRISTEDRKQYTVLVFAEGYATAEWGPIDLDPQVPVDGIEIELVRGGSIEGRVLAPPGREPAGMLVSVSRGDGDVRFDRTNDDGSYRFDGLTPGGWNVAYRVREAQDSTRYMATGDASWEPRWDCDVVDGLVTQHDIDLRYGSLAKIGGRIVVDGEPASGWTAKAVHLYAEELLDPARPIALDAEGRFELAVTPGIYVVTVQSPASDDGYVRLTRNEDVGEEGVEWDLALETAGISGSSSLGQRKVLYTLDLDGGISCNVSVVPDDEGRFTMSGLPIGKAKLYRLEEKPGEGYDLWVLKETLNLEAGEERELVLD